MNSKKIFALRSARVGMAAVAALCTPAFATEGGGSSYPQGAESFLALAMPPPGFYTLGYAIHTRATELRDNNGNDISSAIGGFSVKASVISPRFVYVTDKQVFGGQLAFHAIVPLAHVEVAIGPLRQKKTGLGDVVGGVALGYHASEKLHYAFGLEVNAPTGKYDRNDIANLGRNYWNTQLMSGLSYTQPSGLNGDFKLMYDYNFRNRATDYKSGRELHADYALGWGLGNGWVVGVGGFVYNQESDDDIGGVKVRDNRARAFAIGPSIKYQSKEGFFVTVKYENQSQVRNRSDGKSLWVKAILPF